MLLLYSLACVTRVPPPEPTDIPNDSRWHATFATVAERYATWGTVDDRMRFAPALCAAPTPSGTWQFTASGDDATHGGDKLYLVYALDPVAYGARPSASPPDGLPGVSQVLVKESYRAVAGTGSPDGRSPAERDGQSWTAGERLDLYLMVRMADPSTEGTDQGWVYGTIAPDGTPSSAGNTAACRSCHIRSKNDRWFGIPD